MFGQSFTVADLPVVVTLTFLEGLLSADNALVLAILVRHLPKRQQQKGLLYGLVGAFVLRAIMIVFATFLMKFWWIQGAGAAYLMYLAVHHFARKGGHKEASELGRGFWATVVIIELTDLAFAVDSILAAVALVDTARHPEKLWVVYLGGILGVIAMRFVANFFIQLLERFGRLETSAYLIIGWIALKLGMGAYGHYVETHHPADLMAEQEQHAAPNDANASEANPETPAASAESHVPFGHMPHYVFWPVTVALFAYGFLPEKGKRRRDDPPAH